MELAVHLLSGIRVVCDGVERPVTSRRQRAVVAALALRPGGAVSVEQLVDAVWGDAPPDGARATLQTYVSRLRSTLGEGAVRYGPGGYRLVEGTTCDAELARRLADEATEMLTSDPQGAADAARRALELWDGRALGDLADDAWFAPAAAGLDELRANLVDTAGTALIAAGRARQAVELLEPAARAAPVREPTHVVLVDALCAAGRAVEAVRVASRYRERLRDETGLEPGPDLLAAERRAFDGPPADSADGHAIGQATPRPHVGGILPRGGRLIGRQAELDRLAAALHEASLVTVCGPGGVGKTRLVAELLAQRAPGGTHVVVELGSVGPGDVAAAAASALGVRTEAATALLVAERLRGSDGVLVVDNAEHVVDEVRELVRTVLRRCPRVAVVVTSRTRIELPEETVHQLQPLPTTGASPPAVELFLDRMRRSGGTPVADADDVRRICSRLDGVPLALELAAGRAAVLGVAELRDRIDHALDVVATASGDRHASLRGVVRWSFDLLDEPSRRLLATLGVFEGEFELDAAEQVGTVVLDRPVSLLVGRLVDASLLATTGTPGRYRLLEIVRQFARERLEQEPAEQLAARRAHARWLAGRLAAIDAAATGRDEARTTQRLDAVRDEVRGVLRWARTTQAADVAAAILVPLAGPLLYRPDAELVGNGHALVRLLVDGGAGRPVPAPLLAAGARLAFLAGALDDVDALADAADGVADGDAATRHRAAHARGVVRLYRGRHDAAAAAFGEIATDDGASVVDRLDALGGLALALCYAGRAHDAAPIVATHRAMAETVESDSCRAFADYVHAEVLLDGGDVDGAIEHLRAAADRAWDAGATFVSGVASTVLAGVLVRRRPPMEARDALPSLIERWRRTATWPQLWTTLRLVAELLADRGDDEVAALVLAAADRDPAAPRIAGEDLARDAAVREGLRRRLGEATFAGIVAAVGAVDRTDVLDRAVRALERLRVDTP